MPRIIWKRLKESEVREEYEIRAEEPINEGAIGEKRWKETPGATMTAAREVYAADDVQTMVRMKEEEGDG